MVFFWGGGRGFEIYHKVNSILTAPFTFRCDIYEDVTCVSISPCFLGFCGDSG